MRSLPRVVTLSVALTRRSRRTRADVRLASVRWTVTVRSAAIEYVRLLVTPPVTRLSVPRQRPAAVTPQRSLMLTCRLRETFRLPLPSTTRPTALGFGAGGGVVPAPEPPPAPGPAPGPAGGVPSSCSRMSREDAPTYTGRAPDGSAQSWVCTDQ